MKQYTVVAKTNVLTGFTLHVDAENQRLARAEMEKVLAKLKLKEIEFSGEINQVAVADGSFTLLEVTDGWDIEIEVEEEHQCGPGEVEDAMHTPLEDITADLKAALDDLEFKARSQGYRSFIALGQLWAQVDTTNISEATQDLVKDTLKRIRGY